MTPARRAAVERLKARNNANYGAKVPCARCGLILQRRSIPAHFRKYHGDDTVKPRWGSRGRPASEMFKDKLPLKF
jgi:hypothetical protein